MSVNNKRSGVVMIDNETLGLENRPVIMEIGLAGFVQTWGFDTASHCYTPCAPKLVLLNATANVCRTTEKSTIAWWEDKPAPNAYTNYLQRCSEETDRSPNLRECLEEIDNYLVAMATMHDLRVDEILVMSKSNAFDLAQLRDLYASVNMPTPWKYYNERDFRTLQAHFSYWRMPISKTAISHSAVQDAVDQRDWLISVLSEFNLRPIA